MASPDVSFRFRCKIVLNLVRGESTQRISKVVGCSLSQVYRVARRFVEEGEMGLADRREDNGEAKILEPHFLTRCKESDQCALMNRRL
ncbi:MAG: helix-turn-helix domain-containing protein [Thermoguttaceae bacterium]|jgi:transposase